MSRRSYTSVRLTDGEDPISLSWTDEEHAEIARVALACNVSVSDLIRGIVGAAAGADPLNVAASRSHMELRAWVRVIVLATFMTPLEDQLRRVLMKYPRFM